MEATLSQRCASQNVVLQRPFCDARHETASAAVIGWADSSEDSYLKLPSVFFPCSVSESTSGGQRRPGSAGREDSCTDVLFPGVVELSTLQGR